MKERILTSVVRLKYAVLIPTLFLFLGATAFAQLSGTKYIGGTTPDYATVKDAIQDLNIQGVTAPGVTFLIRDGIYTEDSLSISTATSNSSAPIIFKPDAGASVVINVTPPNSTYDFGIAIIETQSVTIDGSNNGTTTRDLTINSLGAYGEKGIWISGVSFFTSIKNCNVNAAMDIAVPTASHICIDLRYSGALANPEHVLIENNYLKYAYTGVRVEGNAGGDVVQFAIIRNNVIDSVANSGIYSFYQDNTLIYGNDINVLRGSSATIYGLYLGSYTSNTKVFQNKVHDINQLSTTTSATYAIYCSSSSTAGKNIIYNNFVYNVMVTPTGTGAVYGIYHSTANTTEPDTIAYNTINLTGTSDGDRLSTAYYKSSATGPTVVYNNIFQNTRLDGTTGNAVAIGVTTASVNIVSNNNNLYVGPPDGQHHTGRVGTTYYDALIDWQLAMGTDANSVVEDAPFVSTDDLHLQTAVPTQLESAGTPIAGIIVDIDDEVRNAATPDIGADEGSFISLDLTPPDISYVPLGNSSSTTIITLDAVITDVSGVQTGTNGPRLYYKKSTDVSYNFDDIPVIAVDNYTFTIDYANLGGVVVGDTIHYYVAAQDIYGNAGTNPVGGSGSNPPGSVPPDPDNYYVVVAPPLNGTYTVGLAAFSKAIGKNVYKEIRYKKVMKDMRNGSDTYIDIKGLEQPDRNMNKAPNTIALTSVTLQESYTVLMANGKPVGSFYQTDDGRGIYPTITDAVNDLNLRGVDGPVTFLLVDTDFPNETYPILVGEIAGSNSTNTVTFKPGPGIVTRIPGKVDQPTSTFQLGGADYVIIDGSNTPGGTTKDLTIDALNSAPAFHFYGGADNNTVINTNFSSVNTSTGSGTFLFGATNSGDYNTIENCNIQASDTSSSRPAVGIYMFSSNNSTGNQILNCNVTGFASYGIYLRGAPSNNHVVRGNIVDPISPSDASTLAGLRLDGAAGTIIDANYFINLNSTASSPSIYGIYYYGSSISMNVIIQNNIVSLGDQTTAGTMRALDYYGYTPNSVEIYFNTAYIGGSDVTGGSSYGLTKRAGNDTYKIYDNVIYNMRTNGTGTGTHYGVYISTTTATTFELNNNDYFTGGTGGVLGYYGGNEYTTLADWQTATGQDGNSLNTDPQLVSTTDLRPLSTSPLINAGLPIAGITTDILGAIRDASTPTIGAYEEAVYVPLSGVYTIGLSAFNQATGKNVYFETRKTKVRMNLSKQDSWIDLNPTPDKNEKIIKSNGSKQFVEVNKTSKVLMENGKPFNSDFYKSAESRGIYPTITEAVNDLNLRGIDGPVTFLLVDSDYPNETYPIAIGEVTGSNSTNTITFKPGTGIVTQIPGALDQSTSTFQLAGADYVIVDGSNTEGGTTKDLTINALNSSPAFHFYGASDNNIIKNSVFTSLNTSTASGTFLFGAIASGDNNLVENCTIKDNDTSTVKPAVGIYFFSSNVSAGNTILNCEDYNFTDRGMTLQGSPSTNNSIIGNNIYHIIPSTKTTIYGIYVARQYVLNITGNYISNLSSTAASPTIAGVYIIGSSSNPVDVYIQNNVVALSPSNEQAAGTLRGLDYYGYSANSVEMYFNTVYIGGMDVTGGTTAGITKRDVANVYKAYDNAIYNTRSNGTGTGSHYGIYLSNATATTFELNNNDYFTDGTGGILGRFGTTDYTTLSDWQTATSQDANSINNDPQFISNLDYRPASTSPLIGAGLTIAGITNDILGDLRNTPPTIGAYENGVASLPAAPSNLTAVGDTNEVYLQWIDNSNNELGFIIERRLGDTTSVNPFETIDTIAANAQDYMDYNVEPNTTYTYRLSAFNTNGASPYSNIAQATTPIPVELTSFTARIGNSSVILSWSTATETNNNGFEVQRKDADKWEKVTFIKGKGTTTEKSEYSYTDDFKYQSVSGVIVYRLKQVDFSGLFSYSTLLNVSVDFTPKEYSLYQNYPNPFNPSTKIKFALPFDSRVKISIYNILGELVDVILDEVRSTGYHDIPWNGLSMSSGMYIYTIQAKSVDGKKDYSSVKKMMLVK